MKIYISHSRQFDFKQELYAPLRTSALNTEHDIILPHEEHEHAKNFVTRDIIKTCDLVIAEVSFPSTGQGIELGLASAFDRPILCVHKPGAKLSGSLEVICNTFIEYMNADDLIEKIVRAISV